MDERDVVITGVPRSGTTLACQLLNGAENVVALHEPVSLAELRGVRLRRARPRDLADGVDAFFARTRHSLLRDGTAVSKQLGGRVPDNPVGDGARAAAGWRTRLRRARRRMAGASPLRRSQVSRGTIRVDKPLAPDFRLCVKHPSLFTALLGELLPRHPCWALVRNPLAVLGSWNSIDFAVSAGRSRGAERIDRELARRLRRAHDATDRQIRLLDWYFARYRDLLPRERVLRYEDVVASKGSVLERVAASPVPRSDALESRDRSRLYDPDVLIVLGERLLASPGAFWDFYSRESVEAILVTGLH